jgi:hypothetical protein
MTEYANGEIPLSELRETVIGGHLRRSASIDADSMALAFATDFHRSLRATDTYRPIEDQWELWNGPKHDLAAYPGTSVHGEGRAVDFASNIPVHTSAEHKWMDENAGRYGFVNPDWAKAPTRFEPWHWEHVRPATVRHRINRPWLAVGEVGLGSRGAEVASLQSFLNRIYPDLPSIPVDGDFGMATYARLRRFQIRRGILKHGVVTWWTRVLLRRRGWSWTK